MLQRSFIFVLALGAALPAVAQNVAAPAKARATAPDIPFDSVPGFFKMPAGLYMGEGTGIATNSKGHIFVFARSGETRLFEFDQNGAFVKEFGVGSYGFAFAHAVRVDKDDNVWAVDEGTNVVQKFSPDGKLRAVVALEDPGVPNWLDPGGFKEGTIYGRWYGCDSNPTPTLKRVPLADLRKHLPADTPIVTPAERAETLAARVRACQRRRRW